MTDIHPFDLQARAEANARSLVALLDPQRDGLMYFLGNWRARPPRADHSLWDCGDGCGRHTDALTLLRTMVPAHSPAATPATGDEQIEAWLIRLFGAEDLTWLLPEPFAEPWGPQWLLVDWQAGTPAAEISWAQRGTLLGLLTRYQRTADERYLNLAQRQVDGLLRVAERYPQGLCFPEGYYRPDGWHFHGPNLHPALEEYNAAVVLPAIHCYEITHYQPALDLAEGLIRFALYHTPSYQLDGRPRTTEGVNENHFHTRSNFVLSVLKVGLVTGRREYVAWARQGYAHLQSAGTDFGWFPEGFGLRHGEICCTTDMIELALLLGKHVDRAYYADAERYGRNHLLESQFLSLTQMQKALALMPVDEKPGPWEGRYSTVDGVAESQLGGFAARSTLNDAFHMDAPAMMQCCNAAGGRGLYDLWRYAVDETSPPIPLLGAALGEGSTAVLSSKDSEVMQFAVNLRFSVATPALRVVSHEPTTGRLDLTAAQTSQVAVRLPAGVAEALAVWTPPEGRPTIAELRAKDGYVTVDLPPNQPLSLHYALPERTAHYTVGTPERSLQCTGYWRGETLMRVDPPGPYYPLYARASDLEPVQPALPAQGLIDSV